MQCSITRVATTQVVCHTKQQIEYRVSRNDAVLTSVQLLDCGHPPNLAHV